MTAEETLYYIAKNYKEPLSVFDCPPNHLNHNCGCKDLNSCEKCWYKFLTGGYKNFKKPIKK